MIHILHIYPELLNLYGEYANLSLLSRYLKEEGAEVSITTLTLGEALPATGYDMLYLGCGTEDASIRALKALHPFRHILKDYWASGALILATGNSFDLFGQSITDEREGCFDGLSLFDYTVTRTRKTRWLGDAILSCPTLSDKVIGFVNKCSTIHAVTTPWLIAEMGLGNDNQSPAEGMINGSFHGTSLIGPLLIRNPSLCRYFMDKLYDRCQFRPVANANMCLQRKAYAAALSELSSRMR